MTAPPLDIPPARPVRVLWVGSLALTLLGAGVCGAAFAQPSHRCAAAVGWLWAFSFVVSVGLGGLFFLTLHYLTRAAWSVVIKRVADLFAAMLGLTPLMFLPVAAFVVWPSAFGVFPWLDGRDLPVRREYLNAPFFLARGAACVLLWAAFARYFVSRSLAQDGREPEVNVAGLLRLRSLSAPFMVVFAITLTVASVDWLMSLEPTWASTMFGVYVFAGLAETALAVIALATVALRRTGRLPRELVPDDRLYSLGGLMFAFVCFWGYIAFSQYMLIWYANIPEESFYIVDRLTGGWLGVSAALGVVRFAVPFLVLLPRRAKTSPATLVAVSLLLVAGQLLDLNWLIRRAYHSVGLGSYWAEVGPMVLAFGLMGLSAARFVSRHRMVAEGDPMLERSREFHDTQHEGA